MRARRVSIETRGLINRGADYSARYNSPSYFNRGRDFGHEFFPFFFFSLPHPLFSLPDTRRMRIIILRPLLALSGKRDRVSFKFRRKTLGTKNYIRPPFAPLNGIYSRNDAETCPCRALIRRIFNVSLTTLFISPFSTFVFTPKSGNLTEWTMRFLDTSFSRSRECTQTDDNAASVLQLSSANFGAVYFVQVCE